MKEDRMGGRGGGEGGGWMQREKWKEEEVEDATGRKVEVGG